MRNTAFVKALCGIVLLAAIPVVSASVVAATGDGNSKRPNILLIIGDDIGIDVTTDMYPGLIDALTKQYGPSGHNHPKYKEIAGRRRRMLLGGADAGHDQYHGYHDRPVDRNG